MVSLLARPAIVGIGIALALLTALWEEEEEGAAPSALFGFVVDHVVEVRTKACGLCCRGR